MCDGTKPGPGEWNRIHFIVERPGGKQILLLDPSGNIVELFQPRTK